MAQQEHLIKLKWENNAGFTVTSKRNDEAIKTIIQMDENGCIKKLWPHIESICKDFVKALLEEIGVEMKS